MFFDLYSYFFNHEIVSISLQQSNALLKCLENLFSNSIMILKVIENAEDSYVWPIVFFYWMYPQYIKTQ